MSSIPFSEVFNITPESASQFREPIDVHTLIAEGCSPSILEAYLFSNLLKKSPHLADDDTTSTTLADFFESETRARLYHEHFYELREHPAMSKFLDLWREEVYRVIGSSFKPGKFTITSGATSTCGKGNLPFQRFLNAEVTRELQQSPYYDIGLYPCDNTSVGIGVLDIVPKTWKIGRVVIKPCAINALHQKSIGNSLKSCLQMTGIDLTISQDVHKRLAKTASIRGGLTTDDQKWASVLVYSALVAYLVPPEWYQAMYACRDHMIRLPNGENFRVHQFATMGNGFCFELETIIFLSMLRAAAVSDGFPRSRFREIKVFGDDLIYPSELTETVRKYGKAVGFITNVDKSFSEGPFRESCGGDYFDGLDIRPVYLKGDFTDPFDLIVMCNQLYLMQQKYEEIPLFKKLWLRLVRYYYKIVGRKRVLWGPDSIDGCLHGRPLANLVFRTDHNGNQHYKVLKKVFVDKISFRELVYKQKEDYVLRCISAGYLRGHGISLVSDKPLKHWQHGPMRPSYGKYLRSIPVPGSRSKSVVSEQMFFHKPPLSKSEDPLDIFNYLASTNALPFIYSKNYRFAREKARLEYLADLHEKLQMVVNLRREQLKKPTLSIDL